MWQVRIQTIKFADNREATGLWVTPNTPAQAIMDALQIPHPYAVLLLNGGTAAMDAIVHRRLARMLQDGLARVVSEEQITVITGGTEAGIFYLFGQGLAQWGRSAPCIGVAVAELVTWPGHEQGKTPLEPHHSHFILVEGQQWGDETTTMYAVADGLAKDCPSLAVFASGGEIAIREMQANVRQGRTMILLGGSGRATDQVLAARNGQSVEDTRIAEIAQFAGIIPIDLKEQPDLLRQLARQVLKAISAT